MRPFKVRYIETNEVVEHTSIQDIRGGTPFIMIVQPDYLNPKSLDKMIDNFLKKLYKRIDAMASDEHVRISKMEKELGKQAALDFVKRTLQVYRRHVIHQRKKTRHYYSRRAYIESILYFRNYLL